MRIVWAAFIGCGTASRLKSWPLIIFSSCRPFTSTLRRRANLKSTTISLKPESLIIVVARGVPCAGSDECRQPSRFKVLAQNHQRIVHRTRGRSKRCSSTPAPNAAASTKAATVGWRYCCSSLTQLPASSTRVGNVAAGNRRQINDILNPRHQERIKGGRRQSAS